MKLSALFEAEFDVKNAITILKKWSKNNTPDIGKLNNIPPRFKRAEDYLWRGVILNSSDFDDLEDNGHITLPSKGFSSWTEDRTVAEKFVSDSNYGIVIKKQARKLSIWLNVDEFLFYNKIDPSKVLHQSDEREVIVKDSDESLNVKKEEVEGR